MKSKIKTIEAAFKATKRNPKALPNVSKLPEQERQITIDNYKLMVVVEALNQEANAGKIWKPDYTNSNQYKYEPVFGVAANKKHPSGFGFSYSHFVLWFTYTNVGSRLCFINKEVMQYAQKKFKKLYLSVILDQR